MLLSSHLLYPAPLIGPDTTAILFSREEVQHGLAVRETEQRASGESNDSLGTRGALALGHLCKHLSCWMTVCMCVCVVAIERPVCLCAPLLGLFLFLLGLQPVCVCVVSLPLA